MFSPASSASYGRNNSQRGARVSQRSPRPVRRDNTDRWYYQQNGVKLLQISQDNNVVHVTLLRYTSQAAMFSSTTIWKLPFRLKNLKAFLMHPYLSDEEKDALMDRLSGISTDQFKFEHLIAHRLTAICKALPIDTPWENYNKGISVDHDWIDRLFANNSYNSFIQEVLVKNAIKLK